MLTVIDAVVRAADGRLQIAQHRIDPTKARVLGRSAARAGHITLMGSTNMLDMGKTGRTIRDHMRTALQVLCRPVLERFNREARDQFETRKQRLAIWVVCTSATKADLFIAPRPPSL